MTASKTKYTRSILSTLNLSLIDRIYQQVGGELGMFLTFHHVLPDAVDDFAPNAHLTIHPSFLEEVVNLLRNRDIDIISIDEARNRIINPDMSRRFAVLTFDDGYRDTLEHAVPILRRHNAPYTVYIAPGLIDGTADLWWEGIEQVIRNHNRLNVVSGNGEVELDCSNPKSKKTTFDFLLQQLTENVPELEQREYVRELCGRFEVDLDALLQKQMMTWEEVIEVKNDPLSTIGAHTLNHQALARLTQEQAHDEVIHGAYVMERRLGEKPKHFAYPYGYRSAASARDFKILKELDFETATTTRGGMIFPEHRDHLSALPRISVNGLFQHMRYFAPLTSGLPTRLSTRLRRLDVA